MNRQNDQIPIVQSSLQSDTLQVDVQRQIVYENLDDDTPRAIKVSQQDASIHNGPEMRAIEHNDSEERDFAADQ